MAREPLDPGSSTPRSWRVERLEASELRSWTRVELEVPDGLVVITGPNGAGKTSLVEAISLGLVGVSPRTSREAEIVRAGAEALFVRLAVETPRAPSLREVGYAPGLGRRMHVDGSNVRSVRAFRAHGSVLAFLPDELRIVKGPPSARRRALDRLLEGAVPGYADVVSDYAGATAQRNALLRRIRAGEGGEGELVAWDEQVATLGARISSERRRGVVAITDSFAGYLERLGGGSAGRVVHESSPSLLGEVPDDGLVDALRSRLEEVRRRDVAAAQTLSGPHRDDVGVFSGEVDLRRLGSQGEQRSAALALVLAHRDHLAMAAARPVLLLDDALSELDPERRMRVLDALGDSGQAIVTSADAGAAAVAVPRAAAHVLVENGTIRDG